MGRNRHRPLGDGRLFHTLIALRGGCERWEWSPEAGCGAATESPGAWVAQCLGISAADRYKRVTMVRGALPLLIALFASLTLPCSAISPADRAAFASFAGVYSGGVTGESSERSGWIRIAVTNLGRGTAALKLNGAPLITATAYETREADGSVSLRFIPKRGVNLTAELALTKVDGISSITGTVNANGRTAPISVSKLVTKAIPQGWTFQLVNGGGAIGIGAVRIEKSARVTGRVQLAEMPGRTFTTTLKENGKVPVNLAFGSAASGTKLSGDLSFPTGTLTAEDLSTGATSTVNVRGSRYNPLAPALGRKSGSITLQGTNVSGYVVYQAPAKFLNAGFWGFEEGNSAQPRLSLNSALGTISISALNWQPEMSLGVVDQPGGAVSFVTSFSPVMTGSLAGKTVAESTGRGSTPTPTTTRSASSGGVRGGTVNAGSSVGSFTSGIVTTGGTLTPASGSLNIGAPSGGTVTFGGGSTSLTIDYLDGFPTPLVIASTAPSFVVLPSGGALQLGSSSTSSTSSPNLGGSVSITAPDEIGSTASWTASGAVISFGGFSSSASVGGTLTIATPGIQPTLSISPGDAVPIIHASLRPDGQVGDVFTLGAQTFRILEVTSAGYRVEVVP